MDPNLRAQVSRPPSTNIPPQGPPPLSNLQYQMQPHYSMAQPHTLPPLQHPQSHSPVHPSYMGQPYRHEMPRYPPTSANDVYAASSAPMPPHTTVNSLPPSSFLTHHHSQQQFPSHGLLPPSTTSQAYPQPIAPAPPRDRRSDYGGALPSGAFSDAESKGPVVSNTNGLPSTSTAFVPKDPPRTQVVGSQGRRGILPSVPGRAAAITNGANGTGKTAIPAKDADGKFPCPHCNKTYLHAKHLKRHLLRHTGDRPYMCVLCKDTFSRSDILKRHFQKCSLRRGNPTGVSHLSHPHAHLKKAQAAGIVPKPVSGDVSSSVPTSNGIVGTTFGEGNVNGVGMASSHNPGFADQRPLGYPMQPVGGMNRGPVDHGYAQNQMHQRSPWMAEPKQNSYLSQSGTDTNGQSNVDLPPIDAGKAASMPDNKRPGMPTGPSHGQSGDIDWTSMFQTGTHDGYMQPMFPSSVAPVPDSMHSQVDNDRKYYPAATSGQPEGGLNGLYLASTSLGGDGTLDSYPIWNFNVSQNNPLQMKTDRLIDFCFPNGLQEPSNPLDNSAQLKDCLTADNVKHFLELFANYHGHWPYLHIATFNFLDAYDGLVLGMCCIGAVYSDHVSPGLVRSLVTLTKAAILRTSRIQSFLRNDLASDTNALKVEPGHPPPLSSTDIEEMQSIFMLNTLCVWHGDPKQRATARSDIALFVRFIRRFNLLEPAGPKNPSCYSLLHNLLPNQPVDISNWNWLAWVEQEKRSRLVFMFYLADAATVLYFNSQPLLNPQEIKLPLPCDDAAWEARDPQQCADALGLRGPDVQAIANVTGSRRMKQLELNQALSALQSPVVEFRPRSTNVYSKFILIHALHAQIWLLQRQLSFGNAFEIGSHDGFTASTIYNPLSRSECASLDATIVNSNPNYGYSTPTDGGLLDVASVSSSLQNLHTGTIYKSTIQALKKWKRVWDQDMALQYPPTPTLSRRFGFCRDAVPYYWLAHAMLCSNRLNDWKLTPDARLMHVMTMLRKVRAYAQTDAAQRGEGFGSISDIDDSYAVEDLTLDMRLIFRPIKQHFEDFMGTLVDSPLQQRSI
ncbi:hypothetical protein AJ79_08436 [Helicocarpus griseus UAMH5409]|uniref:C2H2-type domain-containing protein n=1 Tax=Helicocarpus griseus UAMH5409 TaxID=1447875 RepID=A0A2B7WTH3_9EURO|nr:hypothetical protein AJ79_08436 [Helicocarpus griseus UAMH5409]